MSEGKGRCERELESRCERVDKERSVPWKRNAKTPRTFLSLFDCVFALRARAKLRNYLADKKKRDDV